MAQHTYQIVLLGADGPRRRGVVSKLVSSLAELGLDAASYEILADRKVETRDRKTAAAAVFFGFPDAVNGEWSLLDGLLSDTIPIVPVVESLVNYKMQVPKSLWAINGKQCDREEHEEEVVSLLLENLNLLRKDRRLFISYKRDESTGVAEQLFDVFAAKGFNSFLDTRSVRPSENFQNELWHRMADSDVVLLLDTPRFRSSEWTAAELAQANSTSVQILHMLWPGVKPDPYSAFSIFSSLDLHDFAFVDRAPDKFSRLAPVTVERIAQELEGLRARAIAARQADLFDSVSDAVSELGGRAILHPQRYITLNHRSLKLAIMPTVGVPSSPRLHSFLKTLRHEHGDYELIALYDERGILDEWRQHLNWLSQHLPVRTLENGLFFKWLMERSKP